MARVKVRCSFVIEVDLPDEIDPVFVVEVNGCAGTGFVGAALQKHMQRHYESSTCWACALDSECKIVQPVPAEG
jgi:hypothetical protein